MPPIDGEDTRGVAPGGTPVDQSVRAQDVTVVTDDEPEDDLVETLRRQLEELEGKAADNQKQLEEEQRRRNAAESARQQAEARAAEVAQQARHVEETSQRSAATAQLDAIKASLDSHMGQLSALEAEYSKAMAEGEFDAAAKVQSKMAVMGGKIATLENGKASLEEQIKAEPQDTGRQQQQTQTPYQQREAYIQRYTPTVQAWLRGPHGERFFNDPDFQRRVIGAASYAENNKGLDKNSKDYIDFIETEVGIRQAPVTPPADTGGAPARGRDADDGRRMTAAPAGGATGGSVRGNPDGDNIVRLTRSEIEMADSMGISHSEYARHKRDLQRENLIGPSARR